MANIGAFNKADLERQLAVLESRLRALESVALKSSAYTELYQLQEKASPASADVLMIEDSEASWRKKRIKISSLPTGGGGGVSDGDKGDIIVSGSGTVWTVDSALLSTLQPIDGDLTAIAALTGTNNIYYRSGVSSWSSVTIGTGLSFAAGTLANTAPAVSTFLDNAFRVQDNADATKQLAYEVSAIATGTTRTEYMPNADISKRMDFAYVYEDFIARPVSATASAANTTIGGVTFNNALVGNWSHVIASLDVKHPGIIRLGLPATANAIAGIYTTAHLSNGGEWLWITFRTPTTFTNLTVKVGFFAGNTAVTTEPTDGMYLWQSAGTSTFGFKTANASTRTTGSTTTLSTNTWYTLSIRMKDSRNSCQFDLYNDAGTNLLSQAITTNLPSASVVLYAQAFVSTSAAAAVTQALDIDMMRVRIGSPGTALTRPIPPGDWSP